VTTTAFYLRDRKDRSSESISIDRQRERCQGIFAAHADQCPSEVVEYVDKSLTSATRPAFQRMVTDIKAGQVAAVITANIDRIARNPGDLDEFFALMDAHGIKSWAGKQDQFNLGRAHDRRIFLAMSMLEMEAESDQ
jgi:DNA invertase Pin-like site-specific DNA recombinase